MAWRVRCSPAALFLCACPPGAVDDGGDTPGTTAATAATAATTETGPDPTTEASATTTTTETTLEPTTLGPTTIAPTTTTGEPACGNGVLEAGEACDDGNLADGDCCSADCATGPAEPGQECWTVNFEGSKNGADEGVGVALDSGASVYIAATVADQIQSGDILVRKYDPGAVSQWTQQYDGGANANDLALALAGDPDGFMIAIGRQTQVQGEPTVFWLTKCTPTGQIVWTVTEPGPVSGAGLAFVDAAGEFVVVGAIAQGNSNALVRRYDANGGELWTRVFEGADQGPDSASGVAVDGAGDIVVVGRESTDAQSFNIWIHKYGPDGSPGWTTTVDGPVSGADWAADVAVDSDDSVIVVGRLEVVDGFADAWVRKYDVAGAELWTHTFAGDAGLSDEAVAVAVAPSGAIAVIGETALTTDDADIFVRKLDADGAELWTRTHGGMQSAEDVAGDVAIGADGSVVAIGAEVVVPAINSDVWLRKYSP